MAFGNDDRSVTSISPTGIVADAAELIGDTEQVLRRHYAKWIPERQERLTRILKDAFEEKPKLTAVRPGRF